MNRVLLRCCQRSWVRCQSHWLVALISLIVVIAVGCQKQETAPPPDTKSADPADTVDQLVLTSGAMYMLPAPMLLYPHSGKRDLNDSSMADLIVLPTGARFRVDDVATAEGAVWYKVRITGGPSGGWKQYDGDSLSGPAILAIIGRSDGIPGWFLSTDLAGQILPQVPDGPVDTTQRVGAKGQR